MASTNPPSSSKDYEGDDSDYNRIRLGNDFKSMICMQIADSSESLPLEEEEEDGRKYTPTPAAAPAGLTVPKSSSAGSKLSHSELSSDIATPTPERPNPLEQVPTARDDGTSTPTETPSPVRSHERGATHTEPLAGRISNMISEEESELEEGDKSMSRQTTASKGSSSGEGKKRPKMDRPSTMRRIGSALKRTVSSTRN